MIPPIAVCSRTSWWMFIPPVSRLGTMSGAQLLDNNLIFGADYFLEMWNRCRELKTQVY